MEENLLRGAIATKYGSCERFAKAINWSGRKARDIVSGRQRMTAQDINEMAECLQITDAGEFMKIFFGRQSTK